MWLVLSKQYSIGNWQAMVGAVCQQVDGGHSMHEHRASLTHPRSLLLGPPAVLNNNIVCTCCCHPVMCMCADPLYMGQHSPVMQMRGRFSL